LDNTDNNNNNIHVFKFRSTPARVNKLVFGYTRQNNKNNILIIIPQVIPYCILHFYHLADWFSKCGPLLQISNCTSTGHKNVVRKLKGRNIGGSDNSAYGHQIIDVNKYNWITQYIWLCSVNGGATIGIDSSEKKWINYAYCRQIKFKDLGISGVNCFYSFSINNQDDEIITKTFDGHKYQESKPYLMTEKIKADQIYSLLSTENDDDDDNYDDDDDDGIWYFLSLCVDHKNKTASMEIRNEFNDAVTIPNVKLFANNNCYTLAVSLKSGKSNCVRLHEFVATDKYLNIPDIINDIIFD